MSGTNSNKFAVYVAAGRIIAMLTQFIMPVFLTHYLSEQNYGLYSQFYLLLTFLGTILCFGIQSNLYYFFSKSSNDTKSALVWNNLFIMCVAGLIGVSILAIPFFRKLLLGDGAIQAYWILIALCIFLYIPTNIISTISVVAKDRVLATFYPPIDIILKILIIIPTALIFNSMTAIFWGIVLLQFIQCVFVYMYVVRKFGSLRLDRLTDFRLIKEQLAYAIPFGGAVIINTICQRFDKIVSVSYLSEKEYAIYALAFFGIPGIMQIYDSIVQVNVTNMSKAFANENKAEVLSLYRDFVRQTLSFSLPLILVGVIFAPQFIEFAFSSRYAATVPYFRIYLLTFIIAMVGCGTILRAVGKTKLSFKAYLISGVIYMPICIVLIRYFGINGAIVSAVLGSCVPRILQMYYEKKWANIPMMSFLPWKDISKILMTALLSLIPILFITIYYDVNIWGAIILSIIYILASYTLQLRYNIFIVPSSTIIKKTKHITAKFHH